MSLTLSLELVFVAVVLVTMLMREYRLQHRPALSDGAVLLHAGRMGGMLLAGFGCIGRLLDAAGYGGTGPTVEVVRLAVVSGVPVGGRGFQEGHTRLWQISTDALTLGAVLLLLCSLLLWWRDLRREPSVRAGA